jgi:hypothetical protein
MSLQKNELQKELIDMPFTTYHINLKVEFPSLYHSHFLYHNNKMYLFMPIEALLDISY